MPYRQVKRTGSRNVTRTRDVIKQDRLGYSEVDIHRPKIIFFEFKGLRPNIPHWIFFADKQMPSFVFVLLKKNCCMMLTLTLFILEDVYLRC